MPIKADSFLRTDPYFGVTVLNGFLPIAKLRPLVGGKRIQDIRDVVAIQQLLHVEIDEIRNGTPRLVAVLDARLGREPE